MSEAPSQPAPEAPKKPKRRIDPARVLIALGWEKRPEGSATPSGRGEDLLARLGVRGGSLAAVAWALFKFIGSNERVATAMEAQTKVAEAQLQETRESRLVMIGFTNAQNATTAALGEVKIAVWGRKAADEPVREARTPKPKPAPASRPAAPTPTRVP